MNNDDLALIARLLAAGCESVSEIDGDLSCFYCRADFDGTKPKHEADCAYVAATERVAGA